MTTLDFRPDPDVEHDLWAPIGYYWYGNDLESIGIAHSVNGKTIRCDHHAD